MASATANANHGKHHFSAKHNYKTNNAMVKTLKILYISVLVLLVTGIISGCKKEKVEVKTSTCRIKSVNHLGTSDLYQFTYNGDGKVVKLTYGNAVVTYEYGDHQVVTRTMRSGLSVSKTVATLNDAGLAVNVRTDDDSTGKYPWLNQSYAYDGDELMRSTTTASYSSIVAISSYSWSNHNMVSIAAGATTSSLEYYTNEPEQIGDYFGFVHLVQGYDIFRTHNLLKSSDAIEILYDFGADHRISSFVLRSAAFRIH